MELGWPYKCLYSIRSLDHMETWPYNVCILSDSSIIWKPGHRNVCTAIRLLDHMKTWPHTCLYSIRSIDRSIVQRWTFPSVFAADCCDGAIIHDHMETSLTRHIRALHPSRPARRLPVFINVMLNSTETSSILGPRVSVRKASRCVFSITGVVQ